MKQFSLFLIGLFFTFQLTAGIYCPSDITVDCTDDIHNTNVTGVATTAGTYAGWTPVYDDWGSVGNCSSGIITRKWYVDLNWNNHLDPNEPFCKQYITVEYDSEDVTIEWPDDISLNCIDEVPSSAPWISHGPCDMIGWSYEDQFFDISQGVCEKILRHFTVINWCTYNHGSEGIWTYTQKIFFEDSEPPTIDVCEDITLSTTDCKGTFTVSNSGSDTGFCTSETIKWIILVDLGSDGSTDYTYGFNQSGDFYVPPTSNGESVEITLPIQVGIGWHNVQWKIYDGCGNQDYCNQMVTMKDLIPPTPVCFTNLSTVLMPAGGMVELNVHTMIKEGYDNCSWPDWIKFSFTPEPGTETMIFDCTNEGVEMVNVYAIDHYGNYNYCKVMILFQDNNDTCPQQMAYSANVMNAKGEGIPDVAVQFVESDGDLRDETMSENNGAFVFDDTQLSESLNLMASKLTDIQDVNVLDLLMMKKYILGQVDLSETATLLGDLNNDGIINVQDLLELRSLILFEEESELVFSNWKASEARYEFQDAWSLWEAAQIDNYYGFTMGNISEDYSKEAILNMSVTPRANDQVEFVEDGDLVHVYLKDNACLNGLQLNIDQLRTSNLLSGQIAVSNISSHEKAGASRIIWTSDDCVSYNTTDPLFSIESVSSNTYSLSGDNVLVKDNLDIEHSISETRKQVENLSQISFKYANELLNVQAEEGTKFTLTVSDTQGRIIENYRSLSGSQSLSFEMEYLGIYLVTIEDHHTKSKNTYKVFMN